VNKNYERSKPSKDILEYFHTLARQLNGVAYQIDLNTYRPFFLEGSWESLTGYTKEDFISGKISWSSITFAEDASTIKCELEKLLSENNYVLDIEYRIVHKNGEVRWVRDIAQKIFDNTDKTFFVRGMILDIGKEKAAELELLQSEERYKTFFNNDSVITLILDPDEQKIIDANNAACNFYGWSHEEFTQKKISDINTLTPQEIQKEINEARAHKRNHFYFKHRLADNSIRDVEIFSAPIKFKNKQVLFSTIKDITENKLMQESLIQAQISIEKARDTIFWIDKDAKIFYANEAACESLEYTKEELLNLSIFDIDPFFNKEIWPSHWEKTKLLKSYKVETYHKSKSGRLFPVEISINFNSYGGKEYHTAFGRDISERRQAEETLKKFKYMFDESQRTAHIGSWELDIVTKEFIWTEETFRIFGQGDKVFQPTFDDFEMLLHEDDRPRLIAHFNETIETKIFNPLDYRVIWPDGSIRWVHATGKVYSDENNKPVRMIGIVQDITEQVKIENYLRASEDKFSKAFHTSPDSININRLEDGIYLEINEGFTKLTGYTKEDVIGKSSLEINIWVNNDDRLVLLKGLKETGEVNNLEAEFRLKDGTFKTGLMSARIIEINGEKCILSIARDISERKFAERALLESEERFHLMFENNGAVMMLIEPGSGKIIDANNAATKFYGHSRQQLCSMTINEISINTDLTVRDRSHEEQNHFVLIHKMANGETRTVEFYSSPITVYGKLYIFGIVYDITDRIKVENELRLRGAALEAAANSIVITDNLGKILWANNSFTKLTGYKLSEVIGQNPRFLKSGLQSDEFYKNLWNTIREGKTWRGELSNMRKDGSLYAEEMTITPIADEAGKISHYIAIKYDITERKKSERELILAKEKAEISETLKSAFLAQMSHEIRSPLYRILGYISLIKDAIKNSGLENNGEINEYFGSIDLSSHRLTRTIDSILNMSELQTQTYQPTFSEINLLELMNRLRKEYLLQASSKKLELNVNSRTKNSTVLCDEYSITQIFANLIDNALKYTNAGGVEIILARNRNKEFFIEVQDSGIGISKEFMEKLFLPFTQEETGYTRKFEGNGLGLALVKSYCDINNAVVEVESEKGKGTTFRVVFKNKAKHKS
jgi:PAS domain S-box-containing protein